MNGVVSQAFNPAETNLQFALYNGWVDI